MNHNTKQLETAPPAPEAVETTTQKQNGQSTTKSYRIRRTNPITGLTSAATRKRRKKLKHHFVEGQRWQRELIETLEWMKPAYVYRVGEELERLFDFYEYDAWAGSGLPEFIVTNRKPTDKELKTLLQPIRGEQADDEEGEDV